MTIKNVLELLELATTPVAKVIHKGDHFKVLALAFKKGMILKEHKSNLPAKLTVLEGSVIYFENDGQKVLNKYETTDIPIGVIHSVECTQDALCLLTQG
jgi:quercetin dioxygenase-like cupin family protein